MNIIFYKLQNKLNDVSKLRTLTATTTYTPLTVTGKLRSSASKITPTIDFAQDITYFNGYNYAYIADFGRYYFIDDVISVRVDITSIVFRVDVLTSFLTLPSADSITGYVVRCNNSSLYNNGIEDMLVQVIGKPDIIEEPTTRMHPTSNYIDTIFNTGDRTIHFYNVTFDVLVDWSGVAGSPLPDTPIPDYLKSGLNVYMYNDVYNIIPNNFYPYSSEFLYLMDNNELGNVQKQGMSNPNDFHSYVKDINIFPFEIYDISNTETYPRSRLFYGGHQLDNTNVVEMPTAGIKIIRTVDDFIVTLPSGYTDYAGYMTNSNHLKLEYYIPYYGWIKLDANSVYNHRLILYYIVNYRTGGAVVNLWDFTDKKLIFSNSCQLALKFGLSQNNAWQVAQRQSAYTSNIILGTLTSIGSMAIGAVTQNPYMVVGGLVSGVHNVASYISNTTTNFEQARASVGDDTVSAFTTQKPLVRFTIDKFAQANNTTIFKEHYGIPTNKETTLGSVKVSGSTVYAQIINMDIEEDGTYLGDITYTEAKELEKLCAEGIYL